MTEVRIDRASEARDQTTRPSDKWVPPTNLPIPPDTADWRFRWIRTSMLGKEDNKNVSARFREGWVACKAEDHPELQLIPDRKSEFQGNLEVGGLLLCKIPQSIAKQRSDYFLNATQQQMASVNSNFMRENDPRMPLVQESTSRTSFRK